MLIPTLLTLLVIFKVVATHVFPLADAAKAHEQSETRHTRGKIVLEIVSQ